MKGITYICRPVSLACLAAITRACRGVTYRRFLPLHRWQFATGPDWSDDDDVRAPGSESDMASLSHGFLSQ